MPLSADDCRPGVVPQPADFGAGPWATEQLSPRRLRHRARILDAAVGAAANGRYHTVRMRDIAARAGVSMTTVYDHFPSKIHLLVTALDGDLLDFATRIGDAMEAAADPFGRLRHVVDELLWGMQSSDRITETFTHAYAAAYTMAIPEADMVRSRTVGLFSAALADQSRPDTTHDIAEILTDVWTCEIFSLVQERSTFADFRHRLLVTIDMFAKATSPT